MRTFERYGLIFSIITAGVMTLVTAHVSWAQQATSSRPIVGLRSADASPILLSGGEIVSSPSETPRMADVLIEGTTIVAVGVDLDVPAGTQRLDLSGKRIYAGLIDAMHDVELPSKPSVDTNGYWNANITPEYRAAWVLDENVTDEKKLRAQGITTQLLAPQDGIIKGTSCVVLLVDPGHSQRLLREDVFQHATLTVPRGSSRASYPSSPMGATALVRQSLYDAMWYRDAVRSHELYPGVSRPEPNAALQTLSQDIEDTVWVFDAANERMAIRVADVADEFALKMMIRGSGYEYRALDEIAGGKRVVLLPVDFPDKPSTDTVAAIRETPLVTWMHWHFAPENPARLHDAGVEFCLTTDGLDDPGQFLKQIRLAVERGLEPTVALASVTTTPASLLGIDRSVGKIQTGMLANFAITDGDLFANDTKVIETWVAGERFHIGDDSEATKDDALIGTWGVRLPTSKKPVAATLVFEKKGKSISGKIRLVKAKADGETKGDDDSDEEGDDDKTKDEDQAKSVELKTLIRQRERLTATMELSELGDDFAKGVSHLTILTVNDSIVESKTTTLAKLTTPDGKTTSISLALQKEEPKEEVSKDDASKDGASKKVDTNGDENSEGENKEGEDSTDSTDVDSEPIDSEAIEMVFPLGAYGFSKKPEQPATVLFRGATVWTCGPEGIVENCDVLVRDGKVAQVGVGLEVPKAAVVIDASGKHITPGLIDCHSHAATDGGVNESGQTITSEVRIGDFIDNSDIKIFRQLAGGVTTVNVLHGSANPIGGQNQVLKFRWGDSMRSMKFDGAPSGIKFALGENVKRSTSRYPNTRMGVEQILRDQFLAARQYDADHKAWKAGNRNMLPPRRDLQLDALVEIQQGQRWVHCHSYRQDEIVATLDVLEEFNIQIGTLQHILEGYKVADRIAAHGAGASSFADWWAYKFEVFDAIPYNGVLMHDAGVVVSFNSDDEELARHLNTEAAKATKYGGVPEQEALKFVTLNPAKQLRIDDRVGSLEVGKDADLVVWSGRPMSTTTRCEQTWVDGRQYFSLAMEKEMRERDATLKARLVQMALNVNADKTSKKKGDAKEEAERWLRYDEFCNAGQNRGDNQ